MKEEIIIKLTGNSDPNGPLKGYRHDILDSDFVSIPEGMSWTDFVSNKIAEWAVEATQGAGNDTYWFVIHRDPLGQPLPQEYLDWVALKEAEEAELNKPVLSGKSLFQLLKNQLKTTRNNQAMYQINAIFDELFSSILREDTITQDQWNDYKTEFTDRCVYTMEGGAQVAESIKDKSKPVLGSNKINPSEANTILISVEAAMSSYRFA